MISRKEVEHLARLAHIELTEAEKTKFERELSGILDFVAKLNEVDTSVIEPMTGGTDLENVMRGDVTQGIDNRGQGIGLVEAAPKHREGYVKVKAVFDKGQ